MRTRPFVSSALTEFTPRNICFAEQDADAAGGGGEQDNGADGEAESDAPEFLFDEDDGGGERESDDDTDELEIGPQKYRVPKAVKEAWNGVQKSTQAEKEAIATAKREQEAREVKHQEQMRLAATYVKEIGKIQAIDEQIADYDKLTAADWLAWARQDAEAAQQAQIGYNAMKAEKQRLMDSVREKENTVKAQRDRELAEARERAEREIATRIKDWSPAKKESLLKVGNELGFSPQELQGVAHDPRVMAMLDELAQARAAKARARKAAEETKAARIAEQGKPEPIARARGNTGSSNSLSDNVSMETFAKNFRKRMGNKLS